MKNKFIIILLLFISSNVISQKWRDSLMVARISYKIGDYKKALRYYQSAQKLAPKELNFSNEIAQSAYKANDYGKAEKIYNNSPSRKGRKIIKSQAYHNIGNARMKQKNYQGAINSYKEALRNNPKDEETRYNLSEAIRQLKNQQKKKDNKKDPKKDQSKDQNKPPKDKKEDKNKKDNPSPPNKKEEDRDKKKFPKKIIDKILDKLMKQEGETKKKIRSEKGDQGEATSGKDW